MSIPSTIIEADGGAFIKLVRTGTAETWLPWLTAEEKIRLNSLSPASRQAEWAAWRALVRDTLGDVPIAYDPAGAPVLGSVCSGNIKHISVSHTRGFAAVMFSRSRCAVDIEDGSRSFDRVAGRCISPAEYALPQSGHRFFKGIMWCIKEAAYKYSGEKELDFLRDITVESMAAGAARTDRSGKAVCRIRGRALPCAGFLMEGGLIIAWIA